MAIPLRMLAGPLCAVAGACTLEGAVGRDVARAAIVADVPDRLRDHLDLVFVVDNTTDSAGLSREVAAVFDQLLHRRLLFVEALDLRLGVVSSDLGAPGAPGCSADGDGGALRVGNREGRCGELLARGERWLDLRIAGGEVDSNVPGLDTTTLSEGGALGAALNEVAACMAELAPTTCGYPQPMAAIQRALDPALGVNPGFLRDGSALGLVVVAGKDDCSATDETFYGGAGDPTYRCFERGVTCSGDDVGAEVGPQRGCRPSSDASQLSAVDAPARFLSQLRPPDAVVAAGAVGDTGSIVVLGGEDDGGDAPSRTLAAACDRDDATVYPAVRLGGFLETFRRHAMSPLCSAGAASVAAPAGAELRDALGHRCLDGRIRDIDPETAGVQWDCAVTAVGADGSRTPLQACDWAWQPFESEGPCFGIYHAGCADFPTRLAVVVNWGPGRGAQAPLGTRTEVRCLVDDEPL